VTAVREQSPGPVALGPGTWLLAQPTPEGSSPHATNCILLRDAAGGVHVIDPGWDTPGNRGSLERAFGGLGAPASVTATHLHPDHLGLTPWLRERFGTPVAVHRLEHEAILRLASAAPTAVGDAAARIEAWGVPVGEAAELLEVARVAATANSRTTSVSTGIGPAGVEIDVLLDDGDLLAVPGRRLTVVSTPGHTPGHICLIEHAADGTPALVLTGDLVLPDIYPGVGLGGASADPLGDYLRSLDRVAAAWSTAAPEALALPGHGSAFTDLTARCAETARHHRVRSEEVAEIVAEHPHASVWEIAERVTWSAGWPNLHGFYRVSALSQIALHLAHLTAARET
jgi:glyoxylase-like metal-dependent hydrolase (beta-lactamase superfamily II)